MLHRLTLRVLPRLTLMVTEESIRKRKRLVMLVPGLVAFAVYRLAKLVVPLSDPATLLVLSGTVSAVTALWAYRLARRASLTILWREDGGRLLGWLVGWIGFAYGVQLSLMVLALLNILVHYDFLRHPDGPAMMAVIIACTSVARDAFEIGHVRRIQRQGESILTFPDGAALRTLLREQARPLLIRSLLAGVGAAGLAVSLEALGEIGRTGLGQLLVVTLAGGTLALWAYLDGQQRPGGWREVLGAVAPAELFRFWWWPGLAFAATYYLVLAGAAFYLLRLGQAEPVVRGLMAGLVGAIMTAYCYYLGYRRALEDRVHRQVPASLLRCPFVFAILSKAAAIPSERAIPQNQVALGETVRRG
ncbi:MAG: hypothetical protein AB1411_16640 [Nitrospirota bacterium]